MKNSEQRDIERRLKELEKDSHPPVNWRELIHSNIERIEQLESENERLIDILVRVVDEKKSLKQRVDLLEKMVDDLLS